MKKYIVLGVLFVLPIVAYLFFASGVNNFVKLPVLTENVGNVNAFRALDGEVADLDNRITVLAFFGDHPGTKKGNAFNANQKIYKRFYQFTDFQFVAVLPDKRETEEEARALKTELSPLTDMGKWKFVFGSERAVEDLFYSLGSHGELDTDLSASRIFIIDRERNLRGRDRDDDTGGPLYGYDATSVAVLNNKMIDDMKILLAEYRLALKKNDDVSRRDSYLKQRK
ncbi:hypothetical protein [Sinomicrobium soli]|uniref:hypothetical protein n=1 Tax=Sinomicrobium sp. N-1-3-6 TaxID=2219864 RepID=UPI000DCE4B51|nr:hypothetical protein [Sinomicrobium sp. N-1-3-6]RAV29685.1 hypothetical protein DN748_06085 [Sinomicrobium sp. N-1-3-6]